VAPRPASDGMRIGEMARLVGVSERTLRYYEELGLVMATRQNPRGSRHYDEVQVARVLRIKELQGCSASTCSRSARSSGQDRIDELRGELAEHDDAPSRRQILQEGCASRAVSTPMWQASWRASPNSWPGRRTDGGHLGPTLGLDATERRIPGLRRPQSDLLRHSRPKRRAIQSGAKRAALVEAMGLGNRSQVMAPPRR